MANNQWELIRDSQGGIFWLAPEIPMPVGATLAPTDISGNFGAYVPPPGAAPPPAPAPVPIAGGGTVLSRNPLIDAPTPQTQYWIVEYSTSNTGLRVATMKALPLGTAGLTYEQALAQVQAYNSTQVQAALPGASSLITGGLPSQSPGPKVGDTTVENGITYRYNGTAWAAVAAPATPPAATVTGGGNMPVNYLEDPGLWQALYEQGMGIPTAGRSRYQKWIAQQYQPTLADYLARAEGLLGPATPQTFAEYLQGRGGQPTQLGGGQAYQTWQGLAPEERASMMERMPEFLPGQMYLGALQGRYAPYVAEGLAEQAFGAPMKRRYEIGPQAQQPTGNTFLDYLRGRFGL